MPGRRYSRRRPTFRDGITPRRAQSSTVDLGTCSSVATSRAVSTSAAVSGRPSGWSRTSTGSGRLMDDTGKRIWLGLSCLGMQQN